MITCAVRFLPKFYLKKTSKKRKKSVIPLQNFAENEDRLAGEGKPFRRDDTSHTGRRCAQTVPFLAPDATSQERYTIP